MGKLHFKYGTMNSGKSLDLIRTIYNYEEMGFKVILVKSSIDSKGGDCIVSRVGVKRKVDYMIDNSSDFISLFDLSDVKVIFVDEAQFFSPKQIDDLFFISKKYDIPVICYGIRTDFMMRSFDGSRRLLEIADVLEEIPTLCKCGNIARFAGRKLNGKFVKNGKQVAIDNGKYEYVPLCGDCYLRDVKKIMF